MNQVQEERKSLKQRIALRDAFRRLQNNRDYHTVIEKMFMEEDCARYARISGLYTRTEEERQDALAKAQAAGHLQEFLMKIVMMGDAAEKSLHDLEELEREGQLASGGDE